MPVPLRLMVTVGALLEIVNCPVTAPAEVRIELNRSNHLACPGFNVKGKFDPKSENPTPGDCGRVHGQRCGTAPRGDRDRHRCRSAYSNIPKRYR